jgi:hypothetical protein
VGENSASYTTPPLYDDVLYQVNVTQSGPGCNTSDEHFINVVADPTLSVDYDSLVCVNTPTQFVGSIEGGTGTAFYTWFQTDSSQVGYGIPLTVPSTENTYDFIYYESYYYNYYGVLSMTGLGCDIDTTQMIFIESLDFPTASFDVDPDSLQQYILEPTFSFFNTSENYTENIWNLGECEEQLPIDELYAYPTSFYNPFAENIIDYTYG